MLTVANLPGVRLGRVRRSILKAAEAGVLISSGALDKAARHSRWRAARDLERLGLVKLERVHARASSGRRHWRLVVAHLTELGRAVLDKFRDVLERGQRVRWSRFETLA